MQVQLPGYLDEVLRLVAEGYTNKEIATKLAYTQDTVSEYVKRLRERLGNEPELSDGQYGTKTALVLIGRRYINLDIRNQSDSDNVQRSTADFIERHGDQANLIYQMRIRGDASLCITHAKRIVDSIEEALKKAVHPHTRGEYWRL